MQRPSWRHLRIGTQSEVATLPVISALPSMLQSRTSRPIPNGSFESTRGTVHAPCESFHSRLCSVLTAIEFTSLLSPMPRDVRAIGTIASSNDAQQSTLERYNSGKRRCQQRCHQVPFSSLHHSSYRDCHWR